MQEECIAAGREWLVQETSLSPSQRAALLELLPLLFAKLTGRAPAVHGLCGPPGSGKSTLAGLLAVALGAAGRTSVVLSLDDYYLTRAERRARARRNHPLYRQRGVPGTHDLDRLLNDLDALVSGQRSLTLPRFDKSLDERMKPGRTLALDAPVERVILEGWCLGVPPESARALEKPVNEREARQDPDGVFRRQVNEWLADYTRRLAPHLATNWYLRPPAWQQVIEWRWAQEQALPLRRRRLGTPAAVADFLALFQRLCEHMQTTCTSWADLVITLDLSHRPDTDKLHDAP